MFMTMKVLIPSTSRPLGPYEISIVFATGFFLWTFLSLFLRGFFLWTFLSLFFAVAARFSHKISNDIFAKLSTCFLRFQP
jgi:hypothetical protein